MSREPRDDLEAPLEPLGEEPGGGGERAPTPQGSEPREDQLEEAAQQILTDVAAIEAQRDEYLAALQRAQADFANYRKRVLRQHEEQASKGALEIVSKLLPVLDTFDLAISHLHGTDDHQQGDALGQARGQLVEILTKEGLERVDTQGVEFDPSVHEAVAHVPTESDEDQAQGPRVDEVLRSGYRWRGQTLRPAMVKVRG
ncbi:MAG: nucleotide exchange factor GrpE [Acidimicrobiales bacterium]